MFNSWIGKKANVKVELNLSNYATNADLKNATGVDTSSFVKITDLANLKSDVDKLDTDKLKNIPTNLDVGKLISVPVDLSKLSGVVKDDVIKRDVYNAKIKNIEDKIPDITNLAATAALTTAENKIPNVSNLVKKANYDAKISKVEKSILLFLIIISSRVIHLMQR